MTQFITQLTNGLGINGSTTKNVEAIGKGISSQVRRLDYDRNRRRHLNTASLVKSVKLVSLASQGTTLGIINTTAYAVSNNKSMDIGSLVNSMASGFIEGATMDLTAAPLRNESEILDILGAVGAASIDAIVSKPFDVTILPSVTDLIVEIAGGSTKGLAAASSTISSSTILQGVKTISSNIVKKTLLIRDSVSLENVLEKLGTKMANQFHRILTSKKTNEQKYVSREALFQQACTGAMTSILDVVDTINAPSVAAGISKLSYSFSKAAVSMDISSNTSNFDDLSQVLSTLAYTISSFIPEIVNRNNNTSISKLMEFTTVSVTKSLAFSNVNSSSLKSVISGVCGSAVSGIKTRELLADSVHAARNGCKQGVKFVSTAKQLTADFEADAERGIINNVLWDTLKV